MRLKCQRCRVRSNLYGWFGLRLCNLCIAAILYQLKREEG